jgi:predicted nucleotidyltransferase
MSASDTRLQQLYINAEEIIAGLVLPVEPYTLYLSGSVIEGYGNADSDLDVFVIYPEELPAIRTDYAIEAKSVSLEYTENWRLDIEAWTKEQVLDVAQRIQKCQLENIQEIITFSDVVAFSDNDIELAHRLRIGIPLLHEEHFQQLRQAFDFKKLARIIMQRRLTTYAGAQEDAAGAITSKQYGTALLTARASVQLAVDILLAAHGETNISNKWRFFKLEKLEDADLLQRYWELETPSLPRQEDVLDYARRCLNFSSQLVLQAQRLVQ